MVGSDLDLDWPMPSAPPPKRQQKIPVKRLPLWRRLLARLKRAAGIKKEQRR